MGRKKWNIFDRILYKLRLKKLNYTLTEADRQLGKVVQQRRALTKIMKEEAQIARYEKEIADVGKKDFEDIFLDLIQTKILGGAAAPAPKHRVAAQYRDLLNTDSSQILENPQQQPPTNLAPLPGFSNIIDSLPPEAFKIAKTLTDSELKEKISEHIQLDDNALNEAVKAIRAKAEVQ